MADLPGAEHGYRFAQFKLAMEILQPLVPPSDVPLDELVEGLKWLRLADDQGYEEATILFDYYLTALTEDQLFQVLEAAEAQLWEMADNPESALGKSAKWCRDNQFGGSGCFTVALEDDEACTPGLSADFMDTIYRNSKAYDQCRLEKWREYFRLVSSMPIRRQEMSLPKVTMSAPKSTARSANSGVGATVPHCFPCFSQAAATLA